MENLQPFATIMVMVLLSLGCYYGWKQIRVLRRLRHEPEQPPADRRYHYGQAWVRLVSSGLMLMLALLIGSSFFLGLEKRADQLVEQGEAQAASGEKPELDPHQKQFLKIYGMLWNAALVVLVLLLLVTAYDLWAIRRYGLRHLRQIQADRREMIEQEIAIIRTQRNGHT